ncbi:FAD-dependent monooxygenase [Fodinicola feengrottensis]|uniref:FAD-dependent monooxygenase n=1 Tax=Fodinicola feengrottensis TaxID=435914 RepID=A0ABN2FRE9_9ACTN
MTTALIIGGGIAGAVTAIALHKAGIGATVYEAYATPADEIGAFLTVGTNGIDALQAVDLDRSVAAAGVPARWLQVFDAAGEQVGQAPITGSERPDLGPRTFKRAALYRVLQDELAARDLPVQRGKRLVDGTATTAGVTATFADGSSAGADVLIGADGVHSVTRQLIDPAAPEPRYTGQHIVYGFTDKTPVEVPADTYQMIRGEKGFFGITGAPAGGLWWFARVSGPELTSAQAAAVTTAQWRDQLIAVFEADRTPAAAVVAATTEPIVGTGNYDVPTVPTWHNGRMTIAGDAAHAASPAAAQGASMAIEDAVVLAKCLRDIADPATAFDTYERHRRERVERLVQASAAMSQRRTQERPDQRSSNANWLRDHHIDWDSRI